MAEGENRIRVIAGNWKMHHGLAETRRYFDRFRPVFEPERIRVVLFPPVVSLAEAGSCDGRDPRVELGAQNIHWEPAGALTGEISAEMVAGAGARLVLVGHSERRHVFGETDPETARKIAAARRAQLLPILCVGETLEEREAGLLREVLSRQLDAVLGSGVEGDLMAGPSGTPPILIAYEPVWAIGTGRTATSSDASDAHGLLRERVSEALGTWTADVVPILYGGSVKPENAGELLASPDVDGVLVGGASLDPDSFAQIVAAAG